MAIDVQIFTHSGRISMSDTFDFKMHRDFKNAYLPLLGNATLQEIEIEMSKVEFLDSSAPGMLMLLKERASAANKTVTLLCVSGIVSQLLEVANFSKVFNMKH
jgi:anti-anti-sigma factor